jgi:hypothetical protein
VLIQRGALVRKAPSGSSLSLRKSSVVAKQDILYCSIIFTSCGLAKLIIKVRNNHSDKKKFSTDPFALT